MIFSEESLTKEFSRKRFVYQVSENASVDISNVKVTQINEHQFEIELDMDRFSITESDRSTSREKYLLTIPAENKVLAVDIMQNGYRRAFHAVCAARVGWEIEMDILRCLYQEHFFYEYE